jgi:hypothetical protein
MKRLCLVLGVVFAVSLLACGCDEEPAEEPACDLGQWNPGIEADQDAVLCSQEHVDQLAGYTALIGANRFVIGFASEEDHETLHCPGGTSHITSLAGLECLQSVDGALAISFVDQLESLDGLENLLYLDEGHFGWDLKITDNPLLPTCEAEQLVAQLQAAGWAGKILIENNNDAATCD